MQILHEWREKVWHNPPAPNPWEEIDLVQKPVFGGSGLTPRAKGSKISAEILLARSLVDVENFTQNRGTSQKL